MNKNTDIALSQFEVLIRDIENKGKEWVQLEAIAKRLQELKKIKLAQIKRELEQNLTKKWPESKLERMAYAHPKYLEFVNEMIHAWSVAETAYVQYEAKKNFLDAQRSTLAFQREKLSKGIM